MPHRTLNVTEGDDLLKDVVGPDVQASLTPEQVLADLKEGNARFAAGEITLRMHVEQVRQAAAGQFPKAIVLSCVDSRVPVEAVFDHGIGDLFVARVAGNFINPDILGSMEFACKVSGAKLVLVLGHGSCGAVMGAIDAVDLGNITGMLDKVQPAVRDLAGYDGDRTTANPDYVQRVADRNVELNIERVRRESPILAEMEHNGEIAIVGGMYDIQTGKVRFFDGS